jgi:hypothetical protein
MNDDELPGLQVDVHEAAGRARAGRVSCVIGTNLIFKTHNLAAYFFAKWEPVVFDLMLLAASVEFCDRIQRRPALGWGRAFEQGATAHWVANARRSLSPGARRLSEELSRGRTRSGI